MKRFDPGNFTDILKKACGGPAFRKSDRQSSHKYRCGTQNQRFELATDLTRMDNPSVQKNDKFI